MSQRIDYYAENDRMYVAVDCIVFGYDDDGLKLLLFRRMVEPLRGQWSLIGSFVRLDEDVDQAARRVLRSHTGLQDVFFEQLHTYGRADRDPGFRCVSVAQYALIRLELHDRDLAERNGASWHGVGELPELCLDHSRMVADALLELRRKSQVRPIGFELLPEKFTLPQLIRLYEAILQSPIDARNFRKKILSLGVLTKLSEKDKTGSRKGAFLYRFDREHYHRLTRSGFDFSL